MPVVLMVLMLLMVLVVLMVLMVLVVLVVFMMLLVNLELPADLGSKHNLLRNYPKDPYAWVQHGSRDVEKRVRL